MTRFLASAVLVSALTPAFASAAGADSLSLGSPAARHTLRADEPAGASATAAQVKTSNGRKSVPFGTEGSEWITVGTGVSHDFQGSAGFDAHVSWSNFIVKDVEFSLELAAWYYAQKKQDALGLNPQMVFRWHFVNNEKWSVFAEAGIGVVASTDNVPDGGTAFNFTPRAGLGFTRLLNDEGLRLQVGLRWAHISNARIRGDNRNPSRDSAMLYAGLMWPF
ncbi:MAG: acyloxyacyl hydrolase [Planctomycetes bacterium]|nr:acyloxyacyl hydrolase [Planctomycetota bacterium]